LGIKTAHAQNARFKTGWIILVVIAVLMTLLHFSLIFILSEPTLFAGFAAFNFYSLVVLLIPFHRVEPWAWWITWVLPLGLALPAASDPNIALYYFSMAAFGVLGLLLTMPEFLSRRPAN
jgi:hypothetical protein